MISEYGSWLGKKTLETLGSMTYGLVQQKDRTNDPTARIEAITAALQFACYAMTPPLEIKKTKIEGNAIKPDEAQLQCITRRFFGYSADNIGNCCVLERCIDEPQRWYPNETEEANSIARILRIAILGLRVLVNINKGSFLYHVILFDARSRPFIEENLKPPTKVSKPPQALDSQEEESSNESAPTINHSKLINRVMVADNVHDFKRPPEYLSLLMRSLHSKQELSYYADLLERGLKDFQQDPSKLPQAVTTLNNIIAGKVTEYINHL